MFKKLLQLVFGDRKERLMKSLREDIDRIREIMETYRDLRDEDFPARTEEFRNRIAGGENTDDLMHEAFALVCEACCRRVGDTWKVVGHEMKWDMIPYDVQIAGALVLHRGSVAEMATGEGKTLAATMPLYLNALEGKGAHLVTVNDYLARRDAEWMGGIYEFLGLKVGYLQNEMDSEERKKEYSCDITYGTNNEFGFDYLRDNMKLELEKQVQRGFHFAIVDEVDSVLIDEARTPLIISGPVPGSSSRQDFELLRNRVEGLVMKQKRMINSRISDLKKIDIEEMDEETEYQVAESLLLARRGDPKNKRFTKLKKETGYEKLMLTLETDLMREKKLHLFDEELYFVVDEKSNTVDLTEKGRNNLSSEERELFVLPDLSMILHQIDQDQTLSEKEKIRRKDREYRKYAEKNDKIHNFNQLLKAYSLFEKDVDYVVQDNKVMIVDEFTGRLMPGRRFSDGLHQALEAKERVRVEKETQTFATITLQNYFRMYDKLSGMTGTAETEEEEFNKIYELPVHVIPTNRPVRRIDYNDQIYRTRKGKIRAIINEIKRLHQKGLPVLVGTISVEFSETLSRILKREGIQHNVLNAKQHRREAEIVAYAGKKGAVTIATNMAGRGTDIKLDRDIVKCETCALRCEETGDCDQYERGLKERCEEDVPCGLHIIGTERHESRRIDRQLRGRAGRQGDPGASKFFISLEDDLMRLFGSDRVTGIMDRLGLEEDEVIEHPFITKAISKSQKRVEMYNFGIRKRLLEYDDVMNKQREVIYERRNEILRSDDLNKLVEDLIEDYIDSVVEKYLPEEIYRDEWEIEPLLNELRETFIVPFELDIDIDEDIEIDMDEIRELLYQRGKEAYRIRKSAIPPEIMTSLEKMIMLQSIDSRWMDHLYKLDNLKEGIHLRSYAQKDPVIEYKQEAFSLFAGMIDEINKSVLRGLFHSQIAEREKANDQGKRIHEVATAYQSAPLQPGMTEEEMKQREKTSDMAGKGSGETVVKDEPKVGRNDPCPCGSGKKYKKCCGKNY
ncbi:MAG: preprotein translocase subunit SecA [Candidatus Krumholzibacteriales bacterium]